MPEIHITPVSSRGPSFSTRRRSPWSRRAMRVLAIVAIALGALALLDAGVTLVWQEPLSAIYAKLRQDHLSGALAKVDRAAPTAVEQRALVNLADVRRRVAFLAGGLEGRAKNGSAVGRIRIPRIGANFVVVKGTDTSDLESGPGIYSETVFPGMAGTTAIAGHRTTYLAPFRHVDQLRAGSRITLEMPYAHFTYTVIAKQVVAPTDVHAAVGNVGYSRLVLSACTPLFSAAKRLLIYARLTRTVPVGAGRVPAVSRPPGAQEALVGDELEQPASARRAVKPSLPRVLESAQPHLVTAPVEQ
jgi:sortase A